LPANAGILNDSIRLHWAIENNLHWNLDVISKENNQKKAIKHYRNLPR
jgi:predicted transposase YbfD/YdcC